MPDPIPATHPTVLPAVPERIYDRWIIEEVLIAGIGTPASPLRGQARFRQVRDLADGTIELAPPEATAILVEPDLYAAAAEDTELGTELAAALDAFTRAAVKLAQARGLL